MATITQVKYLPVATTPSGSDEVLLIQGGAAKRTALSGISGSGSQEYIHSQDIAAALWSIQHNLGKYPHVFVIDSSLSNEQVYGTVTYINGNQLTIEFGGAFTGRAYLLS